jgi:hypothetical protein
MKLYTVRQPRIRTVIYERKIRAESPEEAIAIAEQGTAWPETYDELTVSVDGDDWEAVEVTDPKDLKAHRPLEEELVEEAPAKTCHECGGKLEEGEEGAHRACAEAVSATTSDAHRDCCGDDP